MPSVNLWETFDSATLDATTLSANDNCGDGSWTVGNASSLLSAQAGAEKQLLGTIDGDNDAGGTHGIQYANDGTTYKSGYVEYAMASARSGGVTIGFWMYVPAGMTGVWGEHDIAWIFNPGSDDAYIKIGDLDTGSSIRLKLHNSSAYSTSYITLTPGNWYWITIKWKPNTAGGYRCTVYDTAGVQVGSEIVHQTTPSNNGVTNVGIGSAIGASATGMSGNILFDDLVMDWADPDAAYPLGGPDAGGFLNRNLFWEAY